MKESKKETEKDFLKKKNWKIYEERKEKKKVI